jgi:hypothetical protein
MGMKKVRLEIVGLSYSQTQSGAYALVLGESTVVAAVYQLLLEDSKLKQLLLS